MSDTGQLSHADLSALIEDQSETLRMQDRELRRKGMEIVVLKEALIRLALAYCELLEGERWSEEKDGGEQQRGSRAPDGGT